MDTKTLYKMKKTQKITVIRSQGSFSLNTIVFIFVIIITIISSIVNIFHP